MEVSKVDIKVEVQEGSKITTYTLNTKPTEKAIGEAAKSIKTWLRDTFVKETRETVV
jgi:hypothetical protein